MWLAPSGKSVVYESLGSQPGKTGLMLEQAGNSSDLVEISKLNGEFKKNYGTIIGACLYLRSISAARGRSFFWTGLMFAASPAVLTWLGKFGWLWLLLP
jgi:hypothetical protein